MYIVVNVVNGYGAKAGGPLVAHKSVRAVSFTGGTATGKQISMVAARKLKKVHLECGGKNPAIVCADCDLESTIEGLAFASFCNTGQVVFLFFVML